MATNPDDLSARLGHEAEATALLLAGRRYNLPALIRQTGRKPRPFRPIQPTQALMGSIAAPHLAIAAAWAGERDALMASMSTAATVSRAVDAAASRVAYSVMQAKSRFRPAIDRLASWHREKWLQRVRTSTGLDVAMFTPASDVVADVDHAVAWNQQLADDVHQQAKGRIASGLIVALAAGAPLVEGRRAVDDAVMKARRRAAGIGVDQADKASRAFDRSRRRAASVDQFMWRHTPQKHPRDWHLARDGNVFGEDDIDAGDRAGVPPFCKCYEVPVFG